MRLHRCGERMFALGLVAKTLERDRRRYSSKIVLGLKLASAFNFDHELKNVILVVFRSFGFFIQPGVKGRPRELTGDGRFISLRQASGRLIERSRGHYPTSTVRGSCRLDRVTPLQNATELQPGSKQFAGRPSQRIRRDRQCDARVDGVGNSSDQTGKQSVPDRWTRRLDIPQVLLTEIPSPCPTPPSFAGI